MVEQTSCSSTPSQPNQPNPHKHKTLSAYYPNLYKLHDYLLLLHQPFAPSDPQRTYRSALLQETDPEPYRQLVTTTVCGFSDDSPSFPMVPYGEAATAIQGTQQEVIDRVLGELAKRTYGAGGRLRKGSGKNVLLSGDKFAVDLPINIARPGVDNRHVNSPSAVLRSTPWRILRSRIGDAAFRHLLLHTSLFLPVGNNCYIQLSGEPIYDKYEHPVVCPSKRTVQVNEAEGTGRRRKKRKVCVQGEEERLAHGKAVKRSSSFSEVNITRQKMFYGRPARRPNGAIIHGLPPQHLLNKLASELPTLPSDKSCRLLLQAVFPSVLPENRDNHPRVRGSVQRVPAMLGMMRELLVRQKKVDYGKEVKKCRLRVEDGRLGMELQAVSHDQVCRFIISVLRRILSVSVAGSQHNIITLLRHAKQLVTAKQYEPLSLHNVMQDLIVNDFAWLRTSSETRVSKSEHEKRKRLVGEFVLWLFNDYLIPLVKNTFYITETSATRYETIYYFHDDWASAAKPHFEQLKEELFIELDKNQSHFALHGPLGVSAVRLIPKPNGFRPIVNLGKRIKAKAALGISTTGSSKPLSANQILRPIHQVLTFEKERKRSSLGSSLFGTNEIFAPLRALKRELVQLHGHVPRLYFVKMDIKAAFDTIEQDKMLEIVERLLDQNHDYCLMLYSLLLPPASKASHGAARRLFKSRAVLNDGMASSFGDHAQDIAKPLRNAVLVDLVRRRQVSRESCLQLLRLHIKENTWQIGSKLFRQKTGIPQGSKISSLLCSIFYAALEIQHLSFVRRPGSRLLRYIDDFLFISDDYATARRFVSTMQGGFPEYGAFISPSKTLLSFEYATGSQVAPVCDLDGALFPYCGFLIDMRTLDLSMDYPRMLSGPIQQSFALRSNRHRGTNFVGWLSRQLENRNHVAYLDAQHNSLSTVYLNVYLNFALTAMKIPHYFNQRVIPPNQAAVIFHSLCLAVEYTYVAGRARVKHASRDDDSGVEHYAIKRGDFVYIALSAIAKVLSRKASRFKEVLGSVTAKLASREYRKMAERHQTIIERGERAIAGAKY